MTRVYGNITWTCSFCFLPDTSISSDRKTPRYTRYVSDRMFRPLWTGDWLTPRILTRHSTSGRKGTSTLMKTEFCSWSRARHDKHFTRVSYPKIHTIKKTRTRYDFNEVRQKSPHIHWKTHALHSLFKIHNVHDKYWELTMIDVWTSCSLGIHHESVETSTWEDDVHNVWLSAAPENHS